MPFHISEAQLAAANTRFPPLAVGQSLTASLVRADTQVRVDAIRYRGVDLLVTFVPAAPAAGGVRRIAAAQTVATRVEADLTRVLPIFWMASVQRGTDPFPNQLIIPYLGLSDTFTMPFFDDLVITHEGGEWIIPAYEAGKYAVNVGFGIGGGWSAWGYSVPCRSGKNVKMDAGGYQVVRSGGDETIGNPVATGLESWNMPLGSDYLLTFDQAGVGILTKS